MGLHFKKIIARRFFLWVYQIFRTDYSAKHLWKATTVTSILNTHLPPQPKNRKPICFYNLKTVFKESSVMKFCWPKWRIMPCRNLCAISNWTISMRNNYVISRKGIYIWLWDKYTSIDQLFCLQYLKLTRFQYYPNSLFFFQYHGT